jgi:hypothetical protein
MARETAAQAKKRAHAQAREIVAALRRGDCVDAMEGVMRLGLTAGLYPRGRKALVSQGSLKRLFTAVERKCPIKR